MSELDQTRTAHLPQGPIRYREAGEGEPIVFVHGLLVNGRLWEGTAAALAGGARCILPDWPMGSHTTAMRPDADLSAPGMARIVADFLAELDLRDVTLVGNDSGGAISQMVVTRHPERIGRLVLTNCDSHENFPPSPFGKFPRIARLPGVMTALTVPLRIGPVRRAAFRPFSRTAVPDELLRAWGEPSATDASIRRDARKFSMGMDKRYTLEAAERLAGFDKPTLLAWAPEDRLFPIAYARRLRDTIPDARLEEIPDARTFVPVDQPQRLAELIGAFLRETSRTPSAV